MRTGRFYFPELNARTAACCTCLARAGSIGITSLTLAELAKSTKESHLRLCARERRLNRSKNCAYVNIGSKCTSKKTIASWAFQHWKALLIAGQISRSL